MKLTIIQTGEVPEHLRPRFGSYPRMFEQMFDATGEHFTYEVVAASDGEALPHPSTLEGIVITGSPAGVYEDHPWLEPLRDFVRNAYAVRTPMLGICFGHQVMADALGGVVTKSEKGWGIGRHTYRVVTRPACMLDAAEAFSVACSHQDQVIVPPPEAEVLLASDFAPYAGLAYDSGAAISFQPHPEFEDEYAQALAEMRRGLAPDHVVDDAVASFGRPSDSSELAGHIARFFSER